MTINLYFKSFYYGLIFFLIISSSYSNVLSDKEQDLSLDSVDTKIIKNVLQNQKEDSLEFDFYHEGITYKIPIQVGPMWINLPFLDLEKDSTKLSEVKLYNPINRGNKFKTTGDYSRELIISPLEGSGLAGGFQIQLNGEIAKNTFVNGVLTDKNIPFESGGYTRELDELDKVYINISHPYYKLNFGDIMYKNIIGDRISIDRKLVGVKSDLRIGAFDSKAVYATSQGEYHRIEMKGIDGVQGPYRLESKNGNKDITILSGTEEVWLDGKILTRGHNFDYTIDYTLAEIFFTARNLIHSDSDLLIKYQYTDLGYKKNFFGGSINRTLNDNGFIEFGVFKENDNVYIGDSTNSVIQNIFTKEDKNIINVSTAIINNAGNYIRKDNIYIYCADSCSRDDTLYSVSFEFDSNGNYKKMISNKDRIYFEYVNNVLKNDATDYYSPYRKLNAPNTHNYGYIKNKYNFNNFLEIESDIAGSEFNRNNLFYGKNDLGFSANIKASLKKIRLGPFDINLIYKNWSRSKNYKEFGVESINRYKRFWNLDSISISNIRDQTLLTTFNLDGFSRTNIGYSYLDIKESWRQKFIFDHLFVNSLNQNSYSRNILVTGNQNSLLRSENFLQFNLKKTNPFLRYLHENISNSNSINLVSTGLITNSKEAKITTSISKRLNKKVVQNLDSIFVENDYIGSLGYKSKPNKGIRREFTLKKRIKNSGRAALGNFYNYLLLDYNFKFKNLKNPLEWMVNGKLEESVVEKFSVVYDSVGSGLGQYRYESNINSYIRDPNGSFISYNVYTGERRPSKNFESSQNFKLKFDFLNIKENLTFRGISKQKIKGQTIKMNDLVNPLRNQNLTYYLLYNRFELLFSNKLRILAWIENENILNGLDLRGRNYALDKLSGLEVKKTINNYLSLHSTSYFKSFKNSSQFDLKRNRKVIGYWNEFNFNFKLNYQSNVDIIFLYGYNSGNQQTNTFNVEGYGNKVRIKTFFKRKGRIDIDLSYISSSEKNNILLVPPEILNGNPLGKSLTTNTRIIYYLNESISMIYNLRFIDNSRYDDFFSFKGEIRGHF